MTRRREKVYWTLFLMDDHQNTHAKVHVCTYIQASKSQVHVHNCNAMLRAAWNRTIISVLCECAYVTSSIIISVNQT